MVRQAHTYLVGAMSGATLIAAAIAVFVVLVSALVFQDWPIAGLGSGGEDSAAVPGGRSTGPQAGDEAAANGAASGAGGAAATNPSERGKRRQTNATSVDAPGGTTLQPGGGAPGGEAGGEPGGAAGTGTDTGGSGSPAPQGSPAAGGSGAGGGGGGAGAGGGGGGGSGAGGESGSSTSGSVTDTVNETVHGLDETVTGGALEKTGVTGVTEEVVDGTLGPESTVGKVVDETVGVVGGLLHPKR
jgi:hypothetical protein